MQKITDFVLKRPVLTLIVLMLITGFLGQQIYQKARIETNMDEYMPEDYPAFQTSDHYEDLFNIEDAVIVAVSREEGIFNYSTLKKIETITQQLAELEAVKSDQVNSIINARNIEGTEFGLEIGPFVKQLRNDKQLIENFKRDVSENQMVQGRMIADNNRAALISAELKAGEIDRIALYNKVQAITADLEGPEEIYVAGQPVVEGTLARLMPLSTLDCLLLLELW